MRRRIDLGFEAFHASPRGDIDLFRPGTHFGTRIAAQERASATKYAGMDMLLYAVEIFEGDFLVIHDDGTPHDVAYLVSAIRSSDRRALHRFASDSILEAAERDGEAAGMAALARAMVHQGIVGLVYQNAAEDDDSLSWVVFDPKKVAVKNVEALVPDPIGARP